MKIYHKSFTSCGEGFKRGDYQEGLSWNEPNFTNQRRLVYKVLRILPNMPDNKDNMIVREIYFWEWPLFYLWKRRMNKRY